MRRAALLILLLASSAGLQALSAYDQAEAALADGDFARARELAGTAAASGDPMALALKGDCALALGDREGAAQAYARAAQAGADLPQAKAWQAQVDALKAAPTKDEANKIAKLKAQVNARDEALKRKAEADAQSALDAARQAQLDAEKKRQADADAQAKIDAEKKSQADALAKAEADKKAHNDEIARLKAEAEAKPVPSAVPTEDAALAAERQKLADERAALKAERAALDKEKLASTPTRQGQGLTVFLGGGAYDIKMRNAAIDYASVGASSMSGGPHAMRQDAFPLSLGGGLNWNGFALEGVLANSYSEYERNAGMGTETVSIETSMMLFSVGYDWAFIRRGGWLGPVEVALPLRLEFGQASVKTQGYQVDSGLGGPAFGLSLRLWLGGRFMLEARGLYHLLPSDSQVMLPEPLAPSMGGGQSYPFNLSHDGPEFRVNLGWRAF